MLQRLLGPDVPKAPRLPGTYAPKHPLLLRLLCSDILILHPYHVSLSCIIISYSYAVCLNY